MPAGLLLEGLVAILLAVTIVYCFILNRRLAALRHGHADLSAAAKVLYDASEKARVSVDQLRKTSVSIAEELNEKNKAGRAIADELSMIVDSANNLADRLTETVSANRAVRKPDPLESLARLDKGFRRQVERDVHTEGLVEQKSAPREADSPSDRDLRLALKAMR